MRIQIMPATQNKLRSSLQRAARSTSGLAQVRRSFFPKQSTATDRTAAIFCSNCVATGLMLCETARSSMPFRLGAGRNCSARFQITIPLAIPIKTGATNPVCPTWCAARLSCCSTINADMCWWSMHRGCAKRPKRTTRKRR